MKTFTLFLMLIPLLGFTQNNQQPESIIEVSGKAERKLAPDEITIRVELAEYFEGREKISLEQQNQKLVQQLQAAGIGEDRIKLGDSESQYVRVNWLRKDILNNSVINIVAADAEEVSAVFSILDEFRIEYAAITKAEYSKSKEVQKELCKEAIKNAHQNAAELVEAIGYKLGKPVKIRDTIGFIRGSRNQLSDLFDDGVRASGLNIGKNRKAEATTPVIQYEMIHAICQVSVDFTIE